LAGSATTRQFILQARQKGKAVSPSVIVSMKIKSVGAQIAESARLRVGSTARIDAD
jgi:hypothetical protein